MTRLQKVLFGFAAFVFLLHGVGAFFPSALMWATHFYAYLPQPAFYLAAGFAFLMLLPPVGRRAGRLLDPLASALAGRPARVVAGVVIALAVLAFWLARQKMFLLHDERLLIGSLKAGFVGSASKMLGGVLQLEAHNLLNRVIKVGSDTASFRLLSIGSGVVWLVACFSLVGGLTTSGWGRLTLGGLLLLSGMTRMFYGYAENTPLLAAALALYVWAGCRLLRTGRGMPAVVLTGLLAAAMHVTGLLILPSLIFLGLAWAGADAGRRGRLWGGVALLGLAGVALALLAGFTPARLAARYHDYFQQFLPLVGPINAKQPYTLFSARRLLDLLNEQLLLGPFAVLALPLVALATRRLPWRGSPLRAFLGWVLFPPLALALFFNRLLGAFRDWDLLAVVALPATLLVGLSLFETSGASGDAAEPATGAPPRRDPARPGRVGIDRLPGTAMALLAVSLFQLAGWVGIDTNPDWSMKRFESMITAPQASLSRFARSYALEELAGTYLDRNEPLKAIPFYERAARVDPANSKAIGSLGALYMDSGRVAEALPLMREAVRLQPGVAMNHYNLAGALARNGQLDSAAAAYRSTIAMNPQFLQAYQNLGVVLAARGNRAAADSAWRDGLRLFPQEVGLYNNIGANLEAAGRLDPAIEAYRTALNLAPEDGNALFNLSRLLQSANRPTEAQPLLERLVVLEPKNGEASVNLGLIYEQQNRLEDAMKAYSHAMAVNPKLPPAYLNLARLMIGRNDEPGAIQVLEAFLEADSANARKVGVAQFLANVRRKAAADAAAGVPAPGDSAR